MTHFYSCGRDGYTCFRDPAIKCIRSENDATIFIDTVMGMFQRFGPDYIQGPIDEVLQQKASPLFYERRKRRLKLFHSTDSNKSESGHIKIAPQIEGRIVMAPKPVPVIDGPNDVYEDFT